MKNILYISPFSIYPSYNGGSRYIYNYLQELSKKNKIIFIGLKEQKKIPSNTLLKQYNVFQTGIKKYINPLAYWRIVKIAQKEKLDEIVVAMPYQLLFGIFLARIFNVQCVLHEQNIEFLRFRRLGKWWWPVMYAYEQISYLLVDKILYISDTDKDKLLTYFHVPIEKLEYSPYIVDPHIFKPNQTARETVRKELHLDHKQVVLFFGPLDYQPNSEALDIIINKIAPQVYQKNTKIKFLIVGKNPPENINAKNIICTGVVEKIEDYINASDLVIVPLLSGGGVRTKILESLFCEKLVISTSIGAEGIPIKDYANKLIINKNIEDFSQQIIDTFHHHEN